MRFAMSAEVEKALEVGLEQGQLPQGHVEGRGVVLPCVLPGVELDREASTGKTISELVSQAGADLTKESQPFGALDCLLQLGQSLGHFIDGPCQVAHLVLAARQRHRTEIARRDQPGTPLQFAQPTAQSSSEADREDYGRQTERAAAGQGWPDGCPQRIAPERFRIEYKERGVWMGRQS